jgi:beta-mannosidase
MEPSPAIELGGTWRAAPADADLRRDFPSPELDDDGWEPLAVPGHWRSTPAFADSDGPLLYRRRLEAPPTGPDVRSWLVFEGLFYQGHVWFDGCYLGDTEGYFLRHTFEVTDSARAHGEHLLAVDLTCSPETDLTAKRNLTGVFQHWDCLDPDWNPGGIWRPVRLEHTGPVRVRRLRVRCTSADADRAVVAFRAEINSDVARSVRLRTTLGAAVDVRDLPVARGPNVVEWNVTVDEPLLWWPHALGDQPLQEVRVEAEVDGRVSHVIDRRVGLRSLAWDDCVLSVNGERMFVKGSNQGPTRMQLGEASGGELRNDVTLARQAGLDLLRLHAHISRPELYEAADEQGLLLWQDFPLQWGYARSVRRQAVAQARAAVDLLGHHPSIALWCAHNEPFTLDVSPARSYDRAAVARLFTRFAALQALPSWNKSVLDRSVKRALTLADGTRPVLRHSGVLPRPGSTGADSHLYFGWYHGEERDFAGLCRAVPRLARFVSEFGAQAVPDDAEFCEPERWPDLDWDRLARTHGLQKGRFDRYVPPAAFASFADWRDATQRYQAELVKHHVETLRRLKYRPTGGFCQFAFGDGHPAVSWSVLDHRRVPKAGYEALAQACRPVIVVAERLPAELTAGDALELAVHVVNDRRDTLEQAVVDARLSWGDGGERTWRWQGDVPADGCERVGTVRCSAPDVPGPLALSLTLTAGEVEASNRYESSVVAPPS